MERQADDAGAFFYVLQDALRILFVDDDPILLEFAQVHLNTETAKVSVADDGDTALAMLGEVQPDVVLLDLEMPRLDGFEVLRRMRADPAHARTPIIVQTGREDVAAIDKAFRLGATSFVVKPLNWRLLSYQIRYVHRVHLDELSLLAARRQADVAADEALLQLCDAGSRFLAATLRAHPGLKSFAGDYLEALEAASQSAVGAGRRAAG